MTRLAMLVASSVVHLSLVGPLADGRAAAGGWPAGVDSVERTRERMRPGMKGTEAAVQTWKSSYSDYVVEFRRCFVRVTDVHEAVGETLRVWLKRSDADTTWREDTPPDLTIAEDAGWFWGVAGDYLFVDAGTCPCPRGLIIYDLSKGQRILEATYVRHPLEPALRGGRWLTYLEEVEDPSPLPECREASRWAEQGLGVGFEEEVRFDLLLHTKTRSGILTCSSRQ